MSWLTSIFSGFTLNPAIAAAGVGLVAVPIVIHLINRMRYRRVRFAAMDFLLASQQKNRRRVLVEQLLLLLLRILIVLILVLLIARLILDPQALAFIRAGVRTHHLILVDDSASMRSRTGDATAFDASIETVRQLCRTIARERGDQQLTLVFLSRAGENEAMLTERPIDESLLDELETKLRNVKCTHQSLNLLAGLDAVEQRLSEDQTARRHFHLLSDFRNRDWIEQLGLVDRCQKIARGGVSVNLVRATAEPTANRAITDVAGDLSIAATGIPARVQVSVANLTESPLEPLVVGVWQNGERLPVGDRTPPIDPQGRGAAEFDLTFTTAGPQRLAFEIPADDYPPDDQHHIPAPVSSTLPVLVVDGTPGQGDGAKWLARALEPVPGISGISPRVERIDFLRSNPLAQYRAVLMVNVPTLPADAIRSLENYVRAGGGLAWFLGPAVQPTRYNETLLGETLGSGLFPVRLATESQERDAPPNAETLDLNFRPKPRFEPWAKEFKNHWLPNQVNTVLPPADDWIRDDTTRADGVETIATLREGVPLILMHRLGQGRVLTVLTSAGQEWTNWPRQPVFVAWVQTFFRAIARSGQAATMQLCGEPIQFTLPAGEYEPTIRIRTPAGQVDSLRAVPRQPAGNADGASNSQSKEIFLEATYRSTDNPGIYQALLTPSTGGVTEERYFACNVPLLESQLSLADPVVLRDRFGGVKNIFLRNPDDTRWLAVQEAGRDARLLLLVALIVLLLGEQLLAYRLSYHPPVIQKRSFSPSR